MSTSDLIGMDACNVVASLQDGTLSPHDLLDALEQRIAQVDPLVNALPTLCLILGAAGGGPTAGSPPDRAGGPGGSCPCRSRT